MGTFRIEGYERDTGLERVLSIEAPSQSEAIVQGNRMGLVIARIEEVREPPPASGSPLLPPAQVRTFFEVQTLSRTSGAEHWVRVEAPNAEQARERVAALGEIIGGVRLAEIVQSAPATPAQPSTIPGVVACPKCGGTTWAGGRGCLLWVLVILFFPLGLLLLFIKPTWKCQSCRYSFQSYAAPTTIGGGSEFSGGRVIVGVFIGLGILVLLILLANELGR